MLFLAFYECLKVLNDTGAWPRGKSGAAVDHQYLSGDKSGWFRR